MGGLKRVYRVGECCVVQGPCGKFGVIDQHGMAHNDFQVYGPFETLDEAKRVANETDAVAAVEEHRGESLAG